MQTPAMSLVQAGSERFFLESCDLAGLLVNSPLHSLSSFLTPPATILMTRNALQPADGDLLYLLLVRCNGA
jgi:hypothetical protein